MVRVPDPMDDGEKATVEINSVEMRSGMFGSVPQHETIIGVEPVSVPVKEYLRDTANFLLVLTNTKLRCLATLPGSSEYFELSAIGEHNWS